jgi:DeoR family fructose operon transcriptional repressor
MRQFRVLNDRFMLIREHLYRAGSSSIEELAALTRASPATIRRDLQRLEVEGLIERVHGGARIVQGGGREIAFGLREKHNLELKRAIAQAAFALLQPGQTVFFDSGTTILQLARRLRLEPMPLTVLTNGLPVAQELVGVAGVRVIMTGGQLRAENLSLVGPYAQRQQDAFWCDQLFLGASAIADDGRIYSADDAEAAMNAEMLRHAAQRILLTDAGKFGRRAPFAVASLERLTRLITDAALSPEWRDRIARANVALTLVAGAGVAP